TILKVVQQIADHVAENGDLHSMMLTSRMCFDTAAPLIWRRLAYEEVDALLKILFVDWENNGTRIVPLSLERFTLYAAFARSIEISDIFAYWYEDQSRIKFDFPGHLRTAFDHLSSNTEHWFPNLQFLSLFWAECLETLLVTTQFIVPSLRKIELHTVRPKNFEGSQTWPLAVDGLLRRIGGTVHHLGSLSFWESTDDRCGERALAILIPTNPLTQLSISPAMLSRSVVKTAIGSSDLKSLELFSFRPARVEPPLSSFLSVNTLQSLVITAVPSIVLKLLRFLVADLHHITISMKTLHVHPIESAHYQQLGRLVADRFPHVEELILIFSQLYRDEPLLLDYLEPLNRCSSLALFSLYHGGILDVPDGKLDAMATGWPLLREFSLTCLHDKISSFIFGKEAGMSPILKDRPFSSRFYGRD
ncbi:hypothetical protein DACRYDRAFT_19290, partial [Dacryopinax primogenitus]